MSTIKDKLNQELGDMLIQEIHDLNSPDFTARYNALIEKLPAQDTEVLVRIIKFLLVRMEV